MNSYLREGYEGETVEAIKKRLSDDIHGLDPFKASNEGIARHLGHDLAVALDLLSESRAAEARLREALAEAVAHLHPSEPLRQRMVAALSASDGGGGGG